jgi:hypothetical protein
MIDINKKFFGLMISKNLDKSFIIGITFFQIHSHFYESENFHFHFLLELGFWFIELRIGRDY